MPVLCMPAPRCAACLAVQLEVSAVQRSHDGVRALRAVQLQASIAVACSAAERHIRAAVLSSEATMVPAPCTLSSSRRASPLPAVQRSATSEQQVGKGPPCTALWAELAGLRSWMACRMLGPDTPLVEVCIGRAPAAVQLLREQQPLGSWTADAHQSYTDVRQGVAGPSVPASQMVPVSSSMPPRFDTARAVSVCSWLSSWTAPVHTSCADTRQGKWRPQHYCLPRDLSLEQQPWGTPPDVASAVSVCCHLSSWTAAEADPLHTSNTAGRPPGLCTQ